MFSLDNLIKQYTDKRFVFSAMIELCTVCNWKCDYCYLENHSEYGISEEKLKPLLLELREAGCFQITYTGGEIFLRKDIWDIIRYTRALGFEVILFTNFSLLNKKQINELKAYNIAQISCSIFSLHNDVNSSFVHSSNDSLKRVLCNLNYAKKIGVPVEMKVMIMKFNYEELDDFILYSQETGIPVRFDYQILPNRSCDKSNIEKYMLESSTLRKMIVLDDRSHNNDKSDLFMCSSTRNSIVIRADGYFYPCMNYDIRVGKINENTFQEVWNENKDLSFIQNMTWKDNQVCEKCKLKKYCKKCPGLSLRMNNDYSKCNDNDYNIAKMRDEIYE